MKKLKTALQYFVGGVMILLALSLAMIHAGIFSVLIMILAGVILLPPVTRRIPQFRFRKAALIFLSLFLWVFAVTIADIPEVEHTETAASSTVTSENDAAQKAEEAASKAAEEAAKKAAEEAAASEKAAKKAAEAAAASAKVEQEAKAASEKEAAETAAKIEELKTLIEADYKQNDIPRKDKKAMKKPEEELLYQAWRSVAMDKIRDLDDQDAVFREYKNLVSFYKKIYPDSALIHVQSSYVESIDAAESRLKKAKISRYGCSLEDSVVCHETLYVYKQLETYYDDNILGNLRKQLDSLDTSKVTEWLCYDVDYILGDAYPGDNPYVLVSQNQDTFSRRGAYNMSYVDSGTTTKLVDSNGFRMDAPVYYLVDPDVIGKEYGNWVDAKDNAQTIYENVLKDMGL